MIGHGFLPFKEISSVRHRRDGVISQELLFELCVGVPELFADVLVHRASLRREFRHDVSDPMILWDSGIHQQTLADLQKGVDCVVAFPIRQLGLRPEF